MDKEQAKKQIGDLFQKAFDRDQYLHFLKNLLNEVEPRSSHYSGNSVPDAYKQHINQYWRIGKYTDPQRVEVDLYIVEVKSLSKLDRARTALRNFAVRTLSTFNKEHALIAFYAKEDKGADWRFSYVKIEHDAKLEQGKVKLSKELTPAKRYSFLVGEHENTHTAQSQLVDLLAMDYANPSVNEIEQSFSIEKVTKEFFEQYKGLFVMLSKSLAEQSFFQKIEAKRREQQVAKFAKKLLGQIVFLYFLQKKGWLGVGEDVAWGQGQKRFLRELFTGANDAKESYYVDKLQYLFYEALANDRKDQFDPNYYQRFSCKIPFLNGGLFEPDYDWQKIIIDIPNNIFSNQKENSSGDIGSGILDTFDRYNFTIKEDEPLEKEVAIDPEMLGKVFENMLELTERKSKGAFYTPREIVHYMCQESLIHYLNNEVGLETNHKIVKEDIDFLIRKGHLTLENDERVLIKGKETERYSFVLPEKIRKKAELIDERLADIKICDPAIGSGAFPVGLLHEIVHARQALAVHLDEKKRHSTYALKKYTIANSIYGVDLDPSAIDIARLRLWLSLIVDEEDYSKIDALPNLDYKIMQGNSLIEEYEGVKLFDDSFLQEKEAPYVQEKKDLKEEQSIAQREFFAARKRDDEIRIIELNIKLEKIKNKLSSIKGKETKKKKANAKAKGLLKEQGDMFDPVQDRINDARENYERLEEKHKEFFNVSSPAKKRFLREQITDLEWALIEATLIEQNNESSLKTLLEYKTTGEKPFFLWKLNFSEVFKKKGGFDIVIGNPPYMIIQTLSKAYPELVKTYKSQYLSATGKFDIYCLFSERGLNLLSPNGTLNYIMPSKWISSGFGKGLRGIISNKKNLLKLVSFGSHQVFNASTYSSIIWLSNKAGSFMQYYKLNNDLQSYSELNNWLKQIAEKSITIDIKPLSDEVWSFASANVSNILKHVKSYPSINNMLEGIFQGIVTGDNDVFWIRDCKVLKNKIVGYSKALDQEFEFELELLKPLLFGKTIARHTCKFNNTYLIYPYLELGNKTLLIEENQLKNKYPLTYKYFQKLKGRLSSRGTPTMKYKSWYALWNPRIISRLSHPNKIITPDICKGGSMWLDKGGTYFHSDTSYAIIIKNEFNVNTNYLYAVLNSSFTWFFLVNTGSVQRGGYFRFKTSYLKPLPIPSINSLTSKIFDSIAIYLDIAKINIMTSYFDRLIDSLVLEIYFPEEIKAANKEILIHLGELKPITDDMSEEKRLSIIQAEFDRLYDPNHPIRNHLDTLDSVEVVRIIQEALKK